MTKKGALNDEKIFQKNQQDLFFLNFGEISERVKMQNRRIFFELIFRRFFYDYISPKIHSTCIKKVKVG